MSDVARELSKALEQLRVAEEELRKQNEALVAAQLALEGERRRYEELFEIAPIAYLVTDELGTIEAASRLAEDLLGGGKRLLAGKPLAAFVPTHERRGIRKLLAQLAHDMHVHDSEFRLARRDGDDILVRARARAAHGRDGRRELRWSLEDVTKQRHNETELRLLAAELERRGGERTKEVEAERARLAAIVDNLPIGLVLIEAGTERLEMVNEAATAIFGDAVELSEREGYREDGSKYAPDEWPVVRSLRTGEQVSGERGEIVRSDGTRFKVELGSAPIHDSQGRIVSAISVVRDVTERERHEAAEREFVTNAAHELRTPLTAIAGAIEVLQAGAKDDGEARERFLGHIERESKRLQRLVQALLTLARAETGAETAKVEIVPLLGVVEEAIEALEQAAVVPIEIDCPADLGAIANRELLERVVANLVANAAQNTSEGKIAIRAVPTDDVVELSVADTGRGIEPEERDRVFERFFRGTRDRNGFGLGLAIVSQAVRVMDGTIDVDSPEGGGTVVRVRLRAATVLTS
jgi:PAS domain S-box-containing protein